MFEPGISRGAENASDPCFRKKTTSEISKPLKQRAKALTDVKNTIHSHASNLVEKGKNGDKIGFGKQKSKSSKGFTVLDDENNATCGADVTEPEFECINHFFCEKANNYHEAEFLNEYKLTKKELECFSSRRNFFSFQPISLNTRSLSPVEDVEVMLTKKQSLFDDDDDDGIEDIHFEVPEPSYF